MFSEHTIGYLGEISPKYKGIELTKDLLGKVSGEFYVDFYQSIEHILPHYEFLVEERKRI